MSSIVQMREYAVLPFKCIVIVVPSSLIIFVPVHASLIQVADFCDSLFPITHLFVEKAWFFCMRVFIWLPIDNIVDHTAPVIDTLTKVQVSRLFIVTGGGLRVHTQAIISFTLLFLC